MITSCEEYGHALSAGTRLDGTQQDQYEILGVLGVGGFCITYMGRDHLLEHDVAIKEYLPSEIALRKTDGSTVIAKSENLQDDYKWGLDRFLEEARTLKRFREPNIVRVEGFLEANGTAYMIMDYEEGESLDEYLKREDTLTEKQIMAILIPILEGLRAVHAQGFLHRDIKPGNIYLRKNSTPMLLDFGAARQALGEHSRSITGILTMGYAPFEQYSSRGNLSPSTDLYALGATLYRCITGKTAVDAPERIDALHNEESDPLVPASIAGYGKYSEHFLETVDYMLSPLSKNRPQSITEMQEKFLGTEVKEDSIPDEEADKQTVIIKEAEKKTVLAEEIDKKTVIAEEAEKPTVIADSVESTVEIVCPECGGSVTEGQKDCLHCGFPLEDTEMKCPECGDQIDGQPDDCPHCGYPLSQDHEYVETEYNESKNQITSLDDIHLSPGEEVLSVCRPHWFSFAGPVALLVLALLAPFFGRVILFFILLGFGGWKFYSAYMQKQHDQLILTNLRLISVHWKQFAEEMHVVPLYAIQDIKEKYDKDLQRSEFIFSYNPVENMVIQGAVVNDASVMSPASLYFKNMNMESDEFVDVLMERKNISGFKYEYTRYTGKGGEEFDTDAEEKIDGIFAKIGKFYNKHKITIVIAAILVIPFFIVKSNYEGNVCYARDKVIQDQVPYAVDIAIARHPTKMGIGLAFKDMTKEDIVVEVKNKALQEIYNRYPDSGQITCYFQAGGAWFTRDSVRKEMADEIEKEFLKQLK